MKQCRWYEIPHYWPQVEPLIRAALSHGSIAWWPSDIYAMLLARHLQLWCALESEVVRACAVTRIDQWPRARVCAILLLAGTGLDDWFAFDHDIAAWAKTQGCVAIEGPGRRGWERVAKPHGWRPVWTVYRRELLE